MNKHRLRSSVALSVATIAAIAGAVDVHAQSMALEEIVVTARKREESLFEIPVSVSVFSQAQLKRADIDNPVDLSPFVPGLDFQAANSGTDGRGSNPNISFRGIRQQLGTPSTQVGAIFWNGSYMGGGAGIVPIEDLQRVEIIKGPQTAYFGRNTFSGAINYISQEAGDEFGGDAEFSYSPSRDDSYKVSVSAGGPISDKIGIRLNFTQRKDGADFEYGDGEPLDEYVSTSFSGTLSLQPTEKLSIKASGYHVSADDTYVNVSIAATTPAGACNATFSGNYINTASGELTPFTRDFSQLTFGTFCGEFPRGENIITPQARVPTAANTVAGDPSAAFNGNPLMADYGALPDMPNGFGGKNQTYRYQLNIDYDLPGGHTLSAIGSRAVTGSTLAFDQFFGLNASGLLLPRGFQTWIRETYLEARVSSPQDQRFRYLIGLTNYEQMYRNGQTATPNVNFENNDSFAVFGSLDFDITEQLTLSAEARYTDDSAFVFINGNPNLPATSDAVTFESENSFDKFIPRVILSYEPMDRATLYASWSKSALIGTQTNAAVVSELDPALIADPAAIGDFTPPQTNTSYEIGWKQQLDWLQYSAALFHMKWKNQVFQTTVLAGVQTTQLALPGESEYTGIELEAFASPTDWLDINAGVTYVDSELKRYASRSSFEFFVLGSGSLSVQSDGFRPRGIPEWYWNLSATVHGEVMDRQWYVRGDALYEGARFADNEEFNKDPGATKFNLRGGIGLSEAVDLEVYANNITNLKRLPVIAFTTFGFNADRKIFTGPPALREVGMRLLMDF